MLSRGLSYGMLLTSAQLPSERRVNRDLRVMLEEHPGSLLMSTVTKDASYIITLVSSRIRKWKLNI